MLTSSIEAEPFSIEVHNVGKPIPREHLAGLFAPMTRGLGAANSARSVGLGLFIVRAHGGEVSSHRAPRREPASCCAARASGRLVEHRVPEPTSGL
jgi:K+-sensing histidine kinase KdpD